MTYANQIEQGAQEALDTMVVQPTEQAEEAAGEFVLTVEILLIMFITVYLIFNVVKWGRRS